MNLDFLTPKAIPEKDMFLSDERMQYLYAPHMRKSGKLYRLRQTTQEREARALERFWCRMQIVILRVIVRQAAGKRSDDAYTE